jgi:glycosyltransferase involved in cell wall biosynthesis
MMPSETGSPPRVVVLMSTFDGERFVVEQLRSIVEQLPADGRILVRDDGSRDHTVSVIEAMGDARITLKRGRNLGFGSSFLTLLAQAPSNADMVMFADQDDVWLPGKIERAWRHLAPMGGTPALYGSAQMLTDAQLQPLHATRAWSRPPSLRGALAENLITGCTAALNAPAVRLLQRADVADGVHFHDWWMYLVVSAFGRVVFDREPTLLYRQHGSNQIGHGAGWLGRQVHKARFLLRNDWVGILLGQVASLWRHYGADLEPSARQLVTEHFGFEEGRAAPRWRLILGPGRWRETDETAFRLLLAAYKLRLWPPRSRRLQDGHGG